MNGFLPPKYPTVKLSDVPGFRYRGGKATLRKYIARWCPLSGSSYWEPFAGRGNMMFLMKHLAKFQFWHLNDCQTMPFFHSIKDYDGSPIEWPTEEEYRKLLSVGDESLTYLEPALFWSGGTATTTSGSMTTFTGNLYYTEESYRQTLLAIKDMLEWTILTSGDAVRMIDRLGEDESSFGYIDPPYLNAKVGTYDDTMVDRVEMIRALQKAKCKWLLSEYYCKDLVKAFGEPIEKIRFTVRSGKQSTKRKVYECLWAGNYDPIPYPIDFTPGDTPASDYSHRLLSKQPRCCKLRYKQWRELVPKHWTKETTKEQFVRLCRDPYSYYNGRYLQRLK